MNSNRKRNLKKLARDIISATALVGSISAPGSQAIENQQSTGSGSGAALTAAAMLAGCAGIAGTAYLGLKHNREAESVFNEKRFQLEMERSKKLLESEETKQLLDVTGIRVDQVSAFVGFCNEIKIENQSNKLITGADVIHALRKGGDYTKKLLKHLCRQGSAADVQKEIAKELSKQFTESDSELDRVQNAISTITQIHSTAVAWNSMACIGSTEAGGEKADWNSWGGAAGDRTHQLGINAGVRDLSMKGPSNGFSLQNVNFEAGEKLLPDALKPILGDIVWCGVAFAEASTANANRAWIKQGAGVSPVEKGMAKLDNDVAKTTMENGNVPLYLLISSKPTARAADTKLLTMDYFRGIPLFAGLHDKRGKADSPDLKGTIGKWIVSNAAKAPEADRKLQGNDYFN